MAFVLDCSVTMSWVFPDEETEETDRLRDSLLAGRAFVPAIWPIDVGNVLRVATSRGRICMDDWARIRTNLEGPADRDRSGLDVPDLGKRPRTRARTPAFRVRRHVSGAGSANAVASGHPGPRSGGRRDRGGGGSSDGGVDRPRLFATYVTSANLTSNPSHGPPPPPPACPRSGGSTPSDRGGRDHIAQSVRNLRRQGLANLQNAIRRQSDLGGEPLPMSHLDVPEP